MKLIVMLVESTASTLRLSYITVMRTIGLQHPDVLAQYEEKLKQWKKQPALADSCRLTLDVIEGRRCE